MPCQAAATAARSAQKNKSGTTQTICKHSQIHDCSHFATGRVCKTLCDCLCYDGACIAPDCYIPATWQIKTKRRARRGRWLLSVLLLNHRHSDQVPPPHPQDKGLSIATDPPPPGLSWEGGGAPENRVSRQEHNCSRLLNLFFSMHKTKNIYLKNTVCSQPRPPLSSLPLLSCHVMSRSILQNRSYNKFPWWETTPFKYETPKPWS